MAERAESVDDGCLNLDEFELHRCFWDDGCFEIISLELLDLVRPDCLEEGDGAVQDDGDLTESFEEVAALLVWVDSDLDPKGDPIGLTRMVKMTRSETVDSPLIV